MIKDVQERVGSQAGGSDHGLYFPAQAKWLTNTKTLEFYDLKTGDLLEFKKKHRPLKVRMMDNSLKTVLIDESLSITQLVDAVCRKIGISNPEEYSFCREKNGLDGSDSNIAGTVKGKSGLSDSAKGTVKGKSGLSDPTKGTVKGKIEKDSKVTDQVDECKLKQSHQIES